MRTPVQTTITLLLLCVTAAASERAKPSIPGVFVPRAYFGTDRNVQLLAGLLTDGDDRVRERATRDLGQTDNPLAITAVTGAMKDPSPLVRIEALRARLALQPSQAAPLVTAAMNDTDPRVVRAAIQLARHLKDAGLNAAITKQLEQDDASLRASALRTLTMRNVAVDAAILANLIRSGTTDDDHYRTLTGGAWGVRLAALQNAILASKHAGLRSAAVEVVSKNGPAEGVAAAVAAAGKQGDTDLLERIARDKNSILRRGACRGWAAMGNTKRVAAFLDDPSPQVRLAAIRYACGVAMSEETDHLARLMVQAPDDTTHRAARVALGKIGPTAAPEIASTLDAQWKMHPKARSSKLNRPTGGRAALQRDRNIRSCLVLLGELKSPTSVPVMMEMFGQLDIGDSLVGELADASSAIGDRRLIPPLRAALAVVEKRAANYLAAKSNSKMKPPVFSESVTGRVGRALLVFGDTESYKTIVALICLHRGGMPLIRANPLLLSKSGVMVNSPMKREIEDLWAHIISHASFCRSSQYWAMLAAGEHRSAAATTALQTSLTHHRSSRLLMQSAAWALERITGKPTSCGQPMQNEGQWTVRIAR
jgi:HEAT repeat protein